MWQARGFVTTLQAASWRASDAGIVRCVLACGMYPLVGRVLPPVQSGGKQGGKGPAIIITSKADKVLHADECSSFYAMHKLVVQAGSQYRLICSTKLKHTEFGIADQDEWSTLTSCSQF